MTVSLLLYKDERPWDSTMVRTGDDDPLHPRVLVGIAGTMIPQYPGMQQKMGVEQGRNETSVGWIWGRHQAPGAMPKRGDGCSRPGVTAGHGGTEGNIGRIPVLMPSFLP